MWNNIWFDAFSFPKHLCSHRVRWKRWSISMESCKQTNDVFFEEFILKYVHRVKRRRQHMGEVYWWSFSTGTGATGWKPLVRFLSVVPSNGVLQHHYLATAIVWNLLSPLLHGEKSGSGLLLDPLTKTIVCRYSFPFLDALIFRTF